MENELIEVTSTSEAIYIMSTGEVIVAIITDGLLFVEQVKDKIHLHIQPQFGSARTYIGDIEKFKHVYENVTDHDKKFYYRLGFRIDSRKINLTDKIADLFNDTSNSGEDDDDK